MNNNYKPKKREKGQWSHPTIMKIGGSYVNKYSISRIETKANGKGGVNAVVHFNDGGKESMQFKTWDSFGKFLGKYGSRGKRNDTGKNQKETSMNFNWDK